MPLPDLDILVAVAEAGTLTAAAELLGLPRPTLSRRLTRLEEDVGAALVHRTTRVLRLTDAGHELYAHARPIVAAIASATDAVRTRDGVPRGPLRVSAPGAEGLHDMIADFVVRYPDVQLEVVTSTRHVDLVAESFDVAIRAGRLTGPSLISRKLSEVDVIAVASAEYLARHGTPREPADLSRHECLVGFDQGAVPQRSWPLRDGGTIRVRARFASNHPTLPRAVALRHAGIALLPEPFIRTELESGALVHVLPDHLRLSTGVWLVFPERRLMLPRVRAFIDHVAAWPLLF